MSAPVRPAAPAPAQNDSEGRARLLAAGHAAEAAEAADLVAYVQSPAEASDALTDVQARIRNLEATRKGILEPLKEAVKRLNALFDPALQALNGAKDSLKAILAADVDARRAAQKAALADANPRAALQLQATAPKVASRSVLCYRIVDFDKVPREFLTQDDAKIFRAIKEGRMIDGIEIYEETRITAR